MCDMFWLARMKMEHTERIKSLHIGRVKALKCLKFFFYVNCFLLSAQLGSYPFWMDKNIVIYHPMILFVLFVNCLILSCGIVTYVFFLLVDGALVFYRTSLRLIRRAETTPKYLLELKRQQKKLKRLQYACIKTVLFRNYGVTLLLFVLILSQSLLWMKV